jgi:hypothetical protein
MHFGNIFFFIVINICIFETVGCGSWRPPRWPPFQFPGEPGRLRAQSAIFSSKAQMVLVAIRLGLLILVLPVFSAHTFIPPLARKSLEE